MNALRLVREFQELFEQVIADEPNLQSEQLNDLRYGLLDEEVGELAAALVNRDPVAVLDALTDIEYVLAGAWLSLGFHKYRDAALAEVHRSNMSKLDSEGRPVYRADGKVTKGPNYSPPDLAAVLNGGKK